MKDHNVYLNPSINSFGSLLCSVTKSTLKIYIRDQTIQLDLFKSNLDLLDDFFFLEVYIYIYIYILDEY